MCGNYRLSHPTHFPNFIYPFSLQPSFNSFKFSRVLCWHLFCPLFIHPLPFKSLDFFRYISTTFVILFIYVFHFLSLFVLSSIVPYVFECIEFYVAFWRSMSQVLQSGKIQNFQFMYLYYLLYI